MDDLTRVHQVNLQMLKEIDRICRKHRLNYVLDAGTLIGAVRHRGFVPWDDDADVAMTRKNFDAFLKVAPRELPPEMELVMPDEYHGGKGFYDFTPRIIYKNSSTHKKDDPEMAFYEGKINFTGFPVTENSDWIKAYTELAAAINRLAMESKYIKINPEPIENEKYSFRVWLIRIGFGGTEHKISRKLLLANLSGHTAFRTEAQKESHKQKYLAKKAEAANAES